MKKLMTALTISAALLIPGGLYAQHDRDRDHDDHNDRYYDKRHSDYHKWDDHENRAWQKYWQQQHRSEVAWSRANERQRQNYWNWRHNHSDAILNINIR